jgi:hypothetical protein
MRALSVLAVLTAIGCGAAGPMSPRRGATAGPIDPAAFLLEASASGTNLLQAPDESIDALGARRAQARGADRRQVLRDLARAHAAAARGAVRREARRHRADARRFADAAAQGAREDTLAAEAAFLNLWLDYETDARGAASRAERFTTRYRRSGELLVLAWMIRGELALGAEDWRDAREAFRFVLGQLGHPLYGYGLYRTAFAWRGAGDGEQARRAIEEAAALGCDPRASEPISIVALLAARDLGVGTRRAGERDVPASCPEAAEEPHDEDWRPRE